MKEHFPFADESLSGNISSAQGYLQLVGFHLTDLSVISTYNMFSKKLRSAKNNRKQEGPIEDFVSSLQDKLTKAVEYGLSSSIYSAKLALTELTTAQTVVLSLFYGLLYGDEDFCKDLLALPVPQLRSTYLAVWLADDFDFSLQDVEKVLTMMSFLKKCRQFHFPDRVVAIFGGLVSKYNVADCCTEEILQTFSDSSPEFDSFQEMRIIDEFNTRFLSVVSVNFKWNYENGDVKLSVESEEAEDFVIVVYNNPRFERLPDIVTPGPSWEGNEDSRQPVSTSERPVVATICKEESDGELTSSTDEVSDKGTARLYYKFQTFDKKKSEDYLHVREQISGSESFNELFKATDEQGRTLLHRMAEFGLIDSVRLLISNDIDVDVPDVLGKTPLHWASEFDRFEVVELLLEKGANVNARSENGRTPLGYCKTIESKTSNKLINNGGTY